MSTNAEIFKYFTEAIATLQEKLNKVKPEHIDSFNEVVIEMFRESTRSLTWQSVLLELQISMVRDKSEQP